MQIHRKNAREAVENRVFYDTRLRGQHVFDDKLPNQDGRERRRRSVEWSRRRGYPAPDFDPDAQP